MAISDFNTEILRPRKTVLILHRKDQEAAELSEIELDALRLLNEGYAAAGVEEAGIPVFTFVQSRVDFEKYGSEGFNAWADAVCTRYNRTTGKRMYDLVIVPGVSIGAAVGRALKAAMGLVPLFCMAPLPSMESMPPLCKLHLWRIKSVDQIWMVDAECYTDMYQILPAYEKPDAP